MNELDLFAAAIALADPAERAALLERECTGLPELRQRLEQLLDAHFRPEPLLDRRDFDPMRDDSATELGDTPGEHEQAAHAAAARTGLDPARDRSATSTVIQDNRGKDEQAGVVIAGKYTLVEVVGEGGMGSVWRARQTEPVKRFVAVKLIKAGMDSRQVLARFDAERQALALMDHPHIAKVLDGGLHQGRPYFVMELVKGVPITEYCDARRLTPRQRLELFVPVCQAIQHAHQKGIIHRDIKPSNVLIALYDDRPVVKVIDFGVAKATGGALTEQTIDTGFGGVVGTPQYMSPEQATFNNLDIDTRSDVYALGVLLYELLTGSPPFSKADLEKRGVLEMLRVVREEEPPRPSTRLSTADALPALSANRGTDPRSLTGLLRDELDWVVMKALEKDRSRRYETANGFAADVQRYLNGDPVQAHPPSAAYRMRKFVRRHRGRVIAASLILLALLGGVVGTTWGLVRAARANASLLAKNAELAAEQAKVQARFDTAVKAIETFHTGVSEDALLRNEQFKELRTKLLKEAARFYTELETLLAGKTDARSRKTLAAGYFQLGELTNKIGSTPEALAVHRKALALRRELAAAPGADVETRLDVARSLRAEGELLDSMGDLPGARRDYEEQRDIATALEAESAADAVRAVLALSHASIGRILRRTGKPAEALAAYEKARDIQQKLAEANPAVTEFQRDLANSHILIGVVLDDITGRLAEALAAQEKARDIYQKLAEANPADTTFQTTLANCHNNIGFMLEQMGKPAEALAAQEKALDIRQKQAEANPAVTAFQGNLAASHMNIGLVLFRTGKPAETLAAWEKAREIYQKLAEADPAVTGYRNRLAQSHENIGAVLFQTGKQAEALAAFRKAVAIHQKLVDDNPDNTDFRDNLAEDLKNIGPALSRSGKPAEALEAYRKAVTIHQKLPDDNLAHPDSQHWLAAIHGQMGSALLSLGKTAEALEAYRKALPIQQRLADASPANVVMRQRLAESHHNIGRALDRLKRPAEAAVELRRAHELWFKLPSVDVETQVERSRAMALLAGLGGDAKSGVTADEARAFADQSVAALAEVVKLGWASPSELKEPDFDAIRGRDDFRKLFAEVEAKAEKPEDTKRPAERSDDPGAKLEGKK